MTVYEEVNKIIDPVYQVGGSVRDEVMGRTPVDFDFATPLSPDEIEAAIKAVGRKCYNIGKRFGTLGVKIDGQIAEITTFRSEKYKPGSRKPEVNFVGDITADLSRRDFRFNAIAKRDNRFIDPFAGKIDIIEKVIRTVGEPKQRFKEDPLRMLRAARFASQFEFSIDQNLEGFAKNLNYKILEVSRERWVMELDKLLMTDKPSIGLDFLARTKLLNFMIPELSLQVGYEQNSPHHRYTLWEHTKRVVDNSRKELNTRWAALLHDIAKPFVRTDRPDRSNYVKHELLGGEVSDGVALRLRWSRQRQETVKKLIVGHLEQDSPLKEADNKGK